MAKGSTIWHQYEFTWWIVAIFFVVAFWGHVTGTAHWKLLTVAPLLCDEKNSFVCTSGLKSPLRAQSPAFICWESGLVLHFFCLLWNFLLTLPFCKPPPPSFHYRHLSPFLSLVTLFPIKKKHWPRCDSRWWTKHWALQCWASHADTDKGRKTERVFKKKNKSAVSRTLRAVLDVLCCQRG